VRVSEGEHRVHELQLVIQICGPSRYAEWRRGREAAWRRGGGYSTARWPAYLDPGGWGVLLLPVPAGRVGAALGKPPRNTVSPLFTSVPGEGAGTAADAALVVLASWVCNPGPGETARLAPPVIEHVGHQRTIETYGLDWPLPAPDGV
jgi:hypothetical protein